MNVESITYTFVECSYEDITWTFVAQVLNPKGRWMNNRIDHSVKQWYQYILACCYGAFLGLLVFGLWWASNT